MSTYFVAYLQIKKNNTWESVGPFTNKGELKPFYETAGTIRDLFRSSWGWRENEAFEDFHNITKEEINLDNLSPEIFDEINSSIEEGDFSDYYSNEFFKYTSLAALHQYILIHPTIVDYENESDWEENKPIPRIDNPIKNVYNRAMDLLDMMGYYIFSALDEEKVRIVYYLG